MIPVGKVVKPHGVRGEVKIFPLTMNSDLFEGASLHFEGPEGRTGSLKVERARFQGRFGFLKLKGIEDREGAESLMGAVLQIPKDALPALEDGFHYIGDLIGLEVETTGGERVGPIVDVLQVSAHDIYVVEKDGREFLIPAVKDFVKRVDVDEGLIVVEPIEGLLE